MRVKWPIWLNAIIQFSLASDSISGVALTSIYEPLFKQVNASHILCQARVPYALSVMTARVLLSPMRGIHKQKPSDDCNFKWWVFSWTAWWHLKNDLSTLFRRDLNCLSWRTVCYKVMGSAVQNPLLFNQCQWIYVIAHVYTLICMYITKVPLLFFERYIFVLFLPRASLNRITSLSLFVEPNHLSLQLFAVADYGDTAPNGLVFQTACTKDCPGGT